MTKTEALAALVDAQEELRALAPHAKTEKEEDRLRKIAADLELLSGYIYWYAPDFDTVFSADKR